MRFIPKLRKFLCEHGKIYTLRTYRSRSKAYFISVPEVGRCRVRSLRTVYSFNDIDASEVGFSGFDTPSEWWSKAEELSGCGPFRLYEVTKCV